MFANSFPLSAVIVCIKSFIGCKASMVFKANETALQVVVMSESCTTSNFH